MPLFRAAAACCRIIVVSCDSNDDPGESRDIVEQPLLFAATIALPLVFVPMPFVLLPAIAANHCASRKCIDERAGVPLLLLLWLPINDDTDDDDG